VTNMHGVSSTEVNVKVAIQDMRRAWWGWGPVEGQQSLYLPHK